MKQLRSILILLVLTLLPLGIKAEDKKAEGGELNIPEIVLEHLSDSYEWHIATFGDKSVSIPLPIIVRSTQTGEC